MFAQLGTLVAAVPLPPAPAAPSFLKQAGITGILLFAALVILTIIGLRILSKAHNQKVSKTMETGANSIVGLVFVVIGLGGAAVFGIIVSAVNFFTN